MQLPQNYEAKFPDSRQSAGFQILDSLLSLNRKVASIPVNIGFECTCSDVLIRMADTCCRSLCNKRTSLSSGCFTNYNCHQKLTVKGRVAYRFREIITLLFFWLKNSGLFVNLFATYLFILPPVFNIFFVLWTC